MSEQYTPDEAEVRDGYVTGMIRDGEGSDWDEYREGATADFDRFIAQVRTDAYNWGRYDERMAHAWAPPEAEGAPAFVHRLAGAPDES